MRSGWTNRKGGSNPASNTPISLSIGLWNRSPSNSNPVFRAARSANSRTGVQSPAAINVVFIGPTGVGKTGLASGLLLKALQNGYRGLFIKAQDLFDEMYASIADRASRKLIRRWARLDVLLIDEVGYLNLRPEQTNIFFKLMEERYRRKATLITTNLEYEAWPQLLGHKDLTEALLSRLRHQCQTIHINGPSLREPQG